MSFQRCSCRYKYNTYFLLILFYDDSPATALTSLLNEDQIRKKMILKKKWLGLVLLIVVGLVAFSIFITYAVKNQDPRQLEDVYPDSSDKLTVVFPDEQSDSNEMPLQEISLSTTTTTKSPLVSTPAARKAATTETSLPITLIPTKEVGTVEVTSATSEYQSTLQNTLDSKGPNAPNQSKSIANEKPMSSSTRSLPANAADRDPVDLLVHMAVNTSYTCFECEHQIFGVKLYLPLDNMTFGPYYGKGKKKTKKLSAAEACNFLYNIHPKFQPNDESKTEGINCHSTKC
ncbi:unnamed protein product [Allacma fusca]|uniref:Uncharacterized protein n=1 Tax=Allacma fusca TaxID=39272 RepID=A0A8J2P322_9HEXA|nr:unnamed protein product [Allacma fusca]